MPLPVEAIKCQAAVREMADQMQINAQRGVKSLTKQTIIKKKKIQAKIAIIITTNMKIQKISENLTQKAKKREEEKNPDKEEVNDVETKKNISILSI